MGTPKHVLSIEHQGLFSLVRLALVFHQCKLVLGVYLHTKLVSRRYSIRRPLLEDDAMRFFRRLFIFHGRSWSTGFPCSRFNRGIASCRSQWDFYDLSLSWSRGMAEPSWNMWGPPE